MYLPLLLTRARDLSRMCARPRLHLFLALGLWWAATQMTLTSLPLAFLSSYSSCPCRDYARFTDSLQTEYTRSDRVLLLRLGYKKTKASLASTLCFLREIPSFEGACCHLVASLWRCPHGEKLRSLLIAEWNLRAANCMWVQTHPQSSSGMTTAWPVP